MLAALFNEPPNFYVFIGFSLFCGTSIFLWVSRLPKASAFSKRSWGLEIPWEDFGLLIFTCILAAFLALTCLGQIYKILTLDEGTLRAEIREASERYLRDRVPDMEQGAARLAPYFADMYRRAQSQPLDL